MAESPDAALNVAMFAPWHEQCGVRDYTSFLVDALATVPEVASVRIVSAPADAVRHGLGSIVSRYGDDHRRFRQLGSALNGSDVAHIQHQYFLFGGVAPHRTHIDPFLAAIRVPAVMTVHEIATGSGIRGSVVAAANRMNFMPLAIRALIVHTAADRAQLIRLGCNEANIHLIRHPVPPALPLPDPDTARLRMEKQYPALQGKRVLTLYGFLSAKKGHHAALRALAQLPADVALVFAGGRHPDDRTDYVATIEAKIAALGLADRVVTTGYLPAGRVPDVMSVTDIALAPFVQSSGSGSLANLLAYSRAVIASDIEPHRELLAENPRLLALVPTGQSALLAAKIADLLASPERRDLLRQAALEYAATNSYLRMAEATVGVYQQAIGRLIA